MPTGLTVNGVTYQYPNTGDQQWGAAASGWALAITNGTLQKAGGTFTLTADVNFGPNFGLVSAYFTSRTANAAASGAVRLADTDSIGFRNHANGADILLAKNTSDALTWNGVAIASSTGIVPAAAGGTGIDTSASTGVPKVAAGVWSVTARLAASLGGTNLDTSGSTGVPSISSGTWSVAARLVASLGGTNLDTSASTGVATVSSGTWSVPSKLVETLGGTNQSAYTLGDTLYASAANTLSKLTGNTTTTRKFLRQTGDSVNSAAPAWDTLVAGDIPLTGNGTLVPGYTAPATYTMTITGSSANPTKGTMTTDLAYTTKNGKMLTVGYTYVATTGAAAGTGTYLFSINGFTADTTFVRVGTSGFGASTVVGSAIVGSSTNQYIGAVWLYDSTHLAIQFTNDTINPSPAFGSTSNTTLNSTNVTFSFTATFPVTT